MAETIEVLQRSWHVEGQSVRPDHRMVAHTGFLTSARLLAGPEPGRRRRRAHEPESDAPDRDPGPDAAAGSPDAAHDGDPGPDTADAAAGSPDAADDGDRGPDAGPGSDTAAS
jgi:tRNA (adenine57-N1/adenine58-N1)-methyltransferase